MHSPLLSRLRRARYALLLTPALLGGCYIVPIGHHPRPVYGPVYGPSDRQPPPHRHRDRDYRDRDHYRWRGEAPAAPEVASAAPADAPAGTLAAYSAASSISR